MLKSRSKWPPGGWQFFQQETGWALPKGQDFHQSILQIIVHRKANPRFNLSTDYDKVANELDDFQCARLANDPVWCIAEGISNFSGRLPVRRQPEDVKGAVAGASKFLKNSTAGIGLYLEWFGDGKPVAPEVAETRAKACLQCPKHVPGTVFQRFSKAAAVEIMTVFGVLNDLQLKTSVDEQLQICDACDCPMKAKVWCPLPIIKGHLRPEAFAALWEQCWIRNEV